MVVDVHIHLYEEEGYLERLLKECSRIGIDKLCLSTSGPLYGQVENEKIKEAFSRFPDRIFGFAYLKLGEDGPQVVKKLKTEGFRGLKIINPPLNYDDKSFYPVYAEAERQKMPILFHTGIVQRTPRDREYDVSSSRMRPVFLDTIARAFPSLTIIGTHLGTPWLEEASMVMRVNPNVYFDLTGSPYGGWRSRIGPQDLKRLLYWEGAFEKVLFGTDVRVEYLERALKIYEELLQGVNLPPEVLEGIYGRTILRLLGEESLPF